MGPVHVRDRTRLYPAAVTPAAPKTDVRLIAEHHAGHYAGTIGKRGVGLSPMALATLEAWPRPGNVRELQDVVSGS
jgi:transcriptional regulator with GAF, ATPase, and Fis domain